MKNRLPEILFTVLAVVAFGGLLWLGSNLTFRGDEWSAILHADDWSLDRLNRPHIMHWALGLRVIWNSLQAVFGLSSYVPYLAVDLAFHVVVAAGIFTLARRQVPALVALAAGTLFLFIGSGALGLQLAFQLGWNAAAAAGMWALVILLREPRPRRVWLMAVLLLVATATWSSIGLVFVAAAAAVMILSRSRRRHLWAVIPALLAYGAWYLAYGRDTVTSLPPIALVQKYVIDGIAHSMGEVSGLGYQVGLVLAVLVAVAVLANLVRGERLRLALIAGSVGLASLWLILAWGRGVDNPGSFVATRYIYISAIFILVALIGLLSYRGWRRHANRVSFIAAVLVVLAVALAGNLHKLEISDRHKQLQAGEIHAAFELIAAYAGTPAFPLDGTFTASGRTLLRAADPDDRERLSGAMILLDLFERYGSPLDNPLALRGLEVSNVELDRLFAENATGAIEIDYGELPVNPELPVHEGVVGTTANEVAGCLAFEASEEPAHVDVAAPSGSDLYLWSEGDGEATVSVSLRGAFPVPGPTVAVEAGDVVRAGLPDIGAGETVRARITLPIGASSLLCAEAQPVP